MSDPNDLTAALDDAEDAFEYRGHGTPTFETGVEQGEQWKTQMTKACRYLEACRVLRRADGYSGAVLELSFGATERTLEGFLLWDTDANLGDFHDHETVYDRVTERGLVTEETAATLKDLYATNRTAHYYGGRIPTREKEAALFAVATAIHGYVVDQIREGDVCRCGRE
jgi:hypothetical protein